MSESMEHPVAPADAMFDSLEVIQATTAQDCRSSMFEAPTKLRLPGFPRPRVPIRYSAAVADGSPSRSKGVPGGLCGAGVSIRTWGEKVDGFRQSSLRFLPSRPKCIAAQDWIFWGEKEKVMRNSGPRPNIPDPVPLADRHRKCPALDSPPAMHSPS